MCLEKKHYIDLGIHALDVSARKGKIAICAITTGTPYSYDKLFLTQTCNNLSLNRDKALRLTFLSQRRNSPKLDTLTSMMLKCPAPGMSQNLNNNDILLIYGWFNLINNKRNLAIFNLNK